MTEMNKEKGLHIEARLAEQKYFKPSPNFVKQANVSDKAILERFSKENFPKCYEEYAKFLDWEKPWHKVLDASNPPFYKWFVGGKLNVSYNCLDRHLPKRKNNTAILWEGEPYDWRRLSYYDLYREVNELAAALREEFGVRENDIVTLYLPMVPELPISMLACARIGAPHSVVFAGFSGKGFGGKDGRCK